MSDTPREGRSNAGAYIAIAIGVAVVLVGFLAVVVLWFGTGSTSTVILSTPSAPVAAPAAPAAAPAPAPAAGTPPSEQK